MLPRMVLARMSAGCRAITGPLPVTNGWRKTAGELHRTEAAQVVKHEDGAGIEVAPRPGGDLLAARRADTAQAHSHQPAVTIELDRGDERRLGRHASSEFAADAAPRDRTSIIRGPDTGARESIHRPTGGRDSPPRPR